MLLRNGRFTRVLSSVGPLNPAVHLGHFAVGFEFPSRHR
jgi:hypothetical protein